MNNLQIRSEKPTTFDRQHPPYKQKHVHPQTQQAGKVAPTKTHVPQVHDAIRDA